VPESEKTCFIAMPITTHPDQAEIYRGDRHHWIHVMDHLFGPAIEAVGFKVIKPISKGTAMIHADIVKHLSTSDMVLCDLSSLNANVFFELGVRTSLDKPIAIVKDEKMKVIPFDLSGTNVHTYDSALDPWSISEQVDELKEHLKDAEESCNGTNPMWQQYGLKFRAEQPSSDESPTEAKLDLILSRLSQPEPHRFFEGGTVTWQGLADNLPELPSGRILQDLIDEMKSVLTSWSARHHIASHLWMTEPGRFLWILEGNDMTDDQREQVRFFLSKVPLVTEVSFEAEYVPAAGATHVDSFPPF
jgi:hypothetical protein